MSARAEETPRAASAPTADDPGTGGASAYGRALVAVAVTFAALGFLYLLPYLTRHFRYPIGYDVPYYVSTAKMAIAGGVRAIPRIRVGTPALLATLSSLTGQGPFVLVAVIPTVLTVVAALGIGGMARAAFRAGPLAVPVIGFLSWAAFGRNGMLNLHLDNLLNAALVLTAFGAACSIVAWRRGSIAVALLLGAAGYAHWTFYLLAAAIYAVAVAAFIGPAVWARVRHRDGDLTEAARLGLPLVASGAVVAVQLLVLPTAKAGIRLRPNRLRRRFLARLRDWYRWVAFPLAAVGVGAALSVPDPPARARARRFFLLLMASWTLVSLAMGVAQLLGEPTAGGRILHYFFPAPILAGLLVWRLFRLGRRRLATDRRSLTGLASVALAGLILVGFAGMAWRLWAPVRPRFGTGSVAQTVAVGTYAERSAPDRCIVYVLHGQDSWNTVRASLPADVILHAHPFYGDASELTSGTATPDCRPLPADQAVVVVVKAFTADQYAQLLPTVDPARVIAPNVLLLRGPLPAGPVSTPAPPVAGTVVQIVGVPLLLLAILLAIGSGWAVVLGPSDPVARVCLAPGLGAAVTLLAAVGWSFAHLSLSGVAGAAPAVLGAAAGGLAALVHVRRARGAGPPAERREGAILPEA